VSTPVAPVGAAREAQPARRRWRPLNRWVGVLLAVLVLAVTAVGVVVTMIGASWSVSGSCCRGGTPDDGAIANTTAVQGFLLAGGLLAAAGVAVAAWLLLAPRRVIVALTVAALVLVPMWTARLAAVDWRGCPTGDTTGFVPPCGTATVALEAETRAAMGALTGTAGAGEAKAALAAFERLQVVTVAHLDHEEAETEDVYLAKREKSGDPGDG
jgi:hypothetical protein